MTEVNFAGTSNRPSDLERTPANHAPETPNDFLARTAQAYPGHAAVVHEDGRSSWRRAAKRWRRLYRPKWHRYSPLRKCAPTMPRTLR